MNDGVGLSVYVDVSRVNACLHGLIYRGKDSRRIYIVKIQ